MSEAPAAGRFAFVYLASQSPRRRSLLTQIGVRHELLLAAADEDAEALEAERPGEAPAVYVERVTRAKLAAARCRRVARGLPAAPILCADTSVTIGRALLGKPRDAAEAAATLRRLAGRSHTVTTVVAVGFAEPEGARAGVVAGRAPEPSVAIATSISRVRFGAIDEAEIARYVDGGEPFGKAGAYAIQSAAAAWIERIEGSYSGIMGLPLYETAQLLRQAGVGF